MEIANLIRNYSKASDVVMIAMKDWSPVAAYFSERRSVIIRKCASEIQTGQPLRIDLFTIDSRRYECRDLAIPQACRVAEVDGIAFGRCVTIDGKAWKSGA